MGYKGGAVFHLSSLPTPSFSHISRSQYTEDISNLTLEEQLMYINHVDEEYKKKCAKMEAERAEESRERAIKREPKIFEQVCFANGVLDKCDEKCYYYLCSRCLKLGEKV